jgi:hypothetical protein
MKAQSVVHRPQVTGLMGIESAGGDAQTDGQPDHQWKDKAPGTGMRYHRFFPPVGADRYRSGFWANFSWQSPKQK